MHLVVPPEIRDNALFLFVKYYRSRIALGINVSRALPGTATEALITRPLMSTFVAAGERRSALPKVAVVFIAGAVAVGVHHVHPSFWARLTLYAMTDLS